MRYLVFLRGIPGSGKSTFIKENRLEPYTISSDEVRLLLKPPVLSVTGKNRDFPENQPQSLGAHLLAY
ncbi:AAA family ATPase [Methanosarcina acetivorans]|uniref:AAA family ATPase n=1 Tax=Methanosarcina acetivorans TaxID=2214 RepID=UPI001D057E40|nr:AAA family ATPase [Methanosarcina acetivorans]